MKRFASERRAFLWKESIGCDHPRPSMPGFADPLPASERDKSVPIPISRTTLNHLYGNDALAAELRSRRAIGVG